MCDLRSQFFKNDLQFLKIFPRFDLPADCAVCTHPPIALYGRRLSDETQKQNFELLSIKSLFVLLTLIKSILRFSSPMLT